MILAIEDSTQGCPPTRRAGENSERVALGKPRTEVSGETNSGSSVIVDFYAAELQEDGSLCKPPSLCYLVPAAQAGRYTSLGSLLSMLH